MRRFVIFSVLLLMVHTCWGTIRHVPSEYGTIEAAIGPANPGDTILVAPGTYYIAIDFGNKGLCLLSELGPEATLLAPVQTNYLIRIGNTGSVPAKVSGFTVAGGIFTTLIRLDGANGAIISNNRFYDLSINQSLILCSAENVTIERNVFAYNLVGHACIGMIGGFNRVVNNTFYQNHRGFYSQAAGNIAYNNIVAYSTEYGIYGSFADLDYNCVIGNHANYESGAAAGENSIAVDPMLESPENYNFTLQLDSPCVDAGHPGEEYLDDDGTRADIGAVLTLRNYPLAREIHLGAYDLAHVLDPLPIITWEYENPEGSAQVAYQIEIGTDMDYSVAESWQSGVVNLPQTIATYAGIPLERDKTYYGRIRVSDAIGFGDWNHFIFRMNQRPTAPQILSPPLFSIHSIFDITLEVQNSTDPNGDPRSYNFVVYDDIGLTNEVTSELGVEEGSMTTSTPWLSALQPDKQYWWRSRVFDGFEYSDWSASSTFYTRSPMMIEVPGDYDFIPQAITGAIHGDTILVKPGAYNEEVDFGHKSLILLSEQGPDVTTLTTAGTHPGTFIKLDGSEFGPTEISGFTIVSEANNSGIDVTPGTTARVHHNRFVGARETDLVVRAGGSSTKIDHNLFVDCNVGSACVGAISGVTTILNNTFYDNSRGIFSQSSFTIAKNNIIVASAEYGVYGSYLQLDFNNVYGNYPNYNGGAVPAGSSISNAPLFRDILQGDFRLTPGSPCIDAGDPIPTYNDPNGTRNDMGAYPFDEIAPSPFSLIAPTSQLSDPETDLFPVFIWEPTTAGDPGDEITYTLKVASDSNFNFVTIIDNLSTSESQLPEALDWGTRYWWKVIATESIGLYTPSTQLNTFRTMTPGDANNSGRLDITDAVYLINYIFAGGPAPQPLIAGNLNCDDRTNISDAVYLVNYMFISGPEPCSSWPSPTPLLDANSAPSSARTKSLGTAE